MEHTTIEQTAERRRSVGRICAQRRVSLGPQAGGRHLRGKLAEQQHNDDRGEKQQRAFTIRRDDSAFTAQMRRHRTLFCNIGRWNDHNE
jgi:hypothetical protein